MGIKTYSFDSGLEIKELPIFEEQTSLDSISRLLPQGLYSTFRTYDGAKKVFGLKTHLNRLEKPSIDPGIKPTVNQGEIRLGLRRILQEFELTEARVRICLSLTEQPGQVFVMVEKLNRIAEEVYKNGVRVVTSKAKRINPRIKSTAFIQASEEERKSLLLNGIYEALIVRNGQILEGLTSNFFAVQNSKIVTARAGILLGVTRRIILRLLRENGKFIDYRGLRIAELPGIDEAFITSSSRGVVPVVKIDGVMIGQGAPGKVATQLRTTYDGYVAKNSELI